MLSGPVDYFPFVFLSLFFFMRRRDPAKVLRGLTSFFSPGKSFSMPAQLIVSQEKPETSQYCKLDRQKGFGIWDIKVGGIDIPPKEEEHTSYIVISWGEISGS